MAAIRNHLGPYPSTRFHAPGSGLSTKFCLLLLLLLAVAPADQTWSLDAMRKARRSRSR